MEHFVHAASILIMVFNVDWLYMRTFILIVDLVHLVLKELIIIPFLVVDYADQQ